MQIGISDPWGTGMKRSTSGVRRSEVKAAEVRFGGLAEASFSTPAFFLVKFIKHRTLYK